MRTETRRKLPALWLRGALVIATILYGCALHLALVRYLNPFWEYFGFTYRASGPPEMLLMVSLLLTVSCVMPVRIASPSSVVLVCLYVAVYVPAVVLTLSLDIDDRVRHYGPMLVALCAVFVAASVASRWQMTRRSRFARLPDDRISYALLFAWAAAAAVLIGIYHSIMSFVSLSNVYDQRAAGASTSAIVGYVQTYFSIVFSTGLIALGLAKERKFFLSLGVIGCVIMYMIDAQRTVFLLPAAMFVLHLALRSRSRLLHSTALPVFAASGIVSFSVVAFSYNKLANAMAQYLTFRSLAFPGLTYPLYFDLFSRDGFTWWSHVKGISSFVKPPASFANDPHWPRLGYIVADRVHHLESNANANLFAGDGVAAAGALGTLVIGAVFILYLFAFDAASARWDRHFASIVALPIGITLMNGQFFSTMLSFGGLFWLAILTLHDPRGATSRDFAAARRQRMRRRRSRDWQAGHSSPAVLRVVPIRRKGSTSGRLFRGHQGAGQC